MRVPHLRHAARSLRRWLPPALAGVVLSLGSCGGGAEPEAAAAPPRGVTHVRLSGPIDIGAQALLSRGVRTAQSRGDRTLLIELDTPGGALDVLWDVQKQLLAADQQGLALACWIREHAASAGALVALTCERVYMSSSGTIGSAYPVRVGPAGLLPLPEDDGVREKELSFLRAQFASMAQKRGRPAPLAEAMVDPGVEVRQVKIDGELRLLDGEAWDALRESATPYELVQTVCAQGKLLNLTAREALDLRFVDGLSDDLGDVLQRLGHAPDAAGAALERSASERAVVWIGMLTPMLILAGLVLGYLELKLPGFGLPGVLSIACFALVVAGKYLAGMADVPHIAIVAVGVVLVVLEILAFPGTLWLGIGGALLVAGGLVSASLGPGFSFSDPLVRDRLLDTGLEYTLAAAGAVVTALVISRWLPKAPVLRHAVLAPDVEGAFAGAMPEAPRLPARGALGRALTDLRPVGKVAVDGQERDEFEARAVGPLIERGARVRVVEVAAARLVVERAERNP